MSHFIIKNICEELSSHLWRTQQKMMLTRERLRTMMMLRSRLKISSTLRLLSSSSSLTVMLVQFQNAMRV